MYCHKMLKIFDEKGVGCKLVTDCEIRNAYSTNFIWAIYQVAKTYPNRVDNDYAHLLTV